MDEAIIEVIAKAMASHPSLRELYANDPALYAHHGRHLYGDPTMPFVETSEAAWILTALVNAGYKVVPV